MAHRDAVWEGEESIPLSYAGWLDRKAEAPDGCEVQAFTPHALALPLPLFSARIAAGFPSPADDHLDDSLDLNEHLVQHPAATFFVRV